MMQTKANARMGLACALTLMANPVFAGTVLETVTQTQTWTSGTGSYSEVLSCESTVLRDECSSDDDDDRFEIQNASGTPLDAHLFTFSPFDTSLGDLQTRRALIEYLPFYIRATEIGDDCSNNTFLGRVLDCSVDTSGTGRVATVVTGLRDSSPSNFRRLGQDTQGGLNTLISGQSISLQQEVFGPNPFNLDPDQIIVELFISVDATLTCTFDEDAFDPSKDCEGGLRARVVDRSSGSGNLAGIGVRVTLYQDYTPFATHDPVPEVPLPASAFLLIAGVGLLSAGRYRRG